MEVVRRLCYTRFMSLSGHTAIGALLGFSIGNPYLGFALGFVSHFLVDLIPHGDHELARELRIHKKKKVPLTLLTVDALLALFLILIFLSMQGYPSRPALLAAIAGSILPDVIVGVHDLTRWRRLCWFANLHFKFHDYFIERWRDVKLRNSIICQLGFIVIVILVL